MFKKLIAKHDVISFDIFDTAILRYVAKPQDIFRLIESKHQLDNFTSVRKKVEQELRQLYSNQEISIEQIYEKLGEYYKQEELITLEIELEKRLTLQNKKVYEIYQEALKQNKTVIFTSDMYLPYAVIEYILKSNGYKEYNQLYVSSVHGTSKHLGGLYQQVKKDYDGKKILHFGDNIYSDIYMAKRNRITPYYIKREKFTDAQQLESVIAKITSTQVPHDNFWRQLGFEKVGLAYYGFTNWIKTQLEQSKPDRVLFLSRDGYIMHNLYNQTQNKIENDYLYVSRKALSFPLLATPQEMVDYYLGYDIITFDMFFNIISLDCVQYESKLNAHNIEIKSKIQTKEDKAKLINFLTDTWSVINEQQKIQHIRILNYIKKTIGESKNIAVVDLGWKGTIQYFLEQYLQEIDPSIKVKGYYLGIGTKNPRMKQEYACYLFDKGEAISDHAKLKYGATIIEFFFSAPHGTVTGYNEDETPILKQTPILIEQFENLKLVHKGAFEFIDELTKFEDVLQLYKISPQQATDNMFKILSSPTKQEVNHLTALYHSDTVDDTILKKIVDLTVISELFKSENIKVSLNKSIGQQVM